MQPITTMPTILNTNKTNLWHHKLGQINQARMHQIQTNSMVIRLD